MDKHLHIVCFDVPYPPDYGGVIDVFYRVKSLYELGVKVHLHCFEYGRKRNEELNQYCATVQYYKRHTGIRGISFCVPYIVYSRRNKKLQEDLLKDDHPVLLEGIHCTWLLYNKSLAHKKTAVRLHNVEYDYYRQLAENERSFFKKIYYRAESALLEKYEKKIAAKAMLLAISQKDADTFKNNFTANDIKVLPASIPFTGIQSKEGKGEYCLYHGNLAIAENEKAVEWLCKLFANADMPLIIAGHEPGAKIISLTGQHKNISLIRDPSSVKMNELIGNAQVNVLPAFQSTGIKLKLLFALFEGRHCLANDVMVNGTGLGKYCQVANSEEDFKRIAGRLFSEPFTKDDIEKRKELLTIFDNTANATLLMKWIC